MNKQEAIQAIKSNYPPSNYTMLREALDLAISALEKQIPKKPKYVETLTFPDTTRPILKYGNCPTCGEIIDTDADRYYCEYKDCGQKLDWEDDGE